MNREIADFSSISALMKPNMDDIYAVSSSISRAYELISGEDGLSSMLTGHISSAIEMTNDISMLKDAISGEFGLLSGMKELSTAFEQNSRHKVDIDIISIPSTTYLNITLPQLTFNSENDVHDILYFDCDKEITSHSNIYMPRIQNNLGYSVNFKMWISVHVTSSLIPPTYMDALSNMWVFEALILDPSEENAIIKTQLKGEGRDPDIYQYSGIFNVNMTHSHKFDYSHSHNASDATTSLSGITNSETFMNESSAVRKYGWTDLYLGLDADTGWFYWMLDVLVLKNSRAIFSIEDIYLRTKDTKLIDSSMI